MKKIFILVILVCLGVGSFLAGYSRQSPPQIQREVQSAVVAREVVQKVSSAPRLLTIPKIDVSSNVESVGMDSKGRMDVPKNADNVAWYNLGAKPGSKGNTVLAGHFDKKSGEPAVFHKLNTLVPGDIILVKDEVGEEYIYKVSRIEEYPYDSFPLQEVFGSTENSMLNLITCEGDWNTETKNYSHRTVVYSQLKE